MEEATNICRLCLKIVGKDVPFSPLTNNNAVLQNLNLISFVTIKNLQLTKNPIICNICNEKLKELAVFKENIITNEFQLQCNERKDLNTFLVSLSEDCTKICRLCLKASENPSKLQKNWKDNKKIFGKCNIHLNLNITNPTKICNKCDLALRDMWIFVTMCLENEKQIVDCATKKGNLTNKDLIEISSSKGKQIIKKSATVDNNNFKKVGESSSKRMKESAKLSSMKVTDGDNAAEKKANDNKLCFQGKEKNENLFSNASREIENKPSTSKARPNQKECNEESNKTLKEEEHLVINRTPRTYSKVKLRSHKVRAPSTKVKILSEICIRKDSKPSTSKATNDSGVLANESIDASPCNVADITWDIGLDMECSRIIEMESRGMQKGNVTQELIELLKVTEESLNTIEERRDLKSKDKYKNADELLKVLEGDKTDQQKCVGKQLDTKKQRKKELKSVDDKKVNIINEDQKERKRNEKVESKDGKNIETVKKRIIKDKSPSNNLAEKITPQISDMVEHENSAKNQKMESVEGLKKAIPATLPTKKVIQNIIQIHSDVLMAQRSSENAKIMSVIEVEKKIPAKKVITSASDTLNDKKTAQNQKIQTAKKCKEKSPETLTARKVDQTNSDMPKDDKNQETQSAEEIRKESPETLPTEKIIQKIIQKHSDTLIAQTSGGNQKMVSVIKVKKKSPVSGKKVIKRSSDMLKDKKIAAEQQKTLPDIQYKVKSPETLTAGKDDQTNSNMPEDDKNQKTQSVGEIRDKISQLVVEEKTILQNAEDSKNKRIRKNQKMKQIEIIPPTSKQTSISVEESQGSSKSKTRGKTNKSITAQAKDNKKPNLRQKSIKDMLKGKAANKKVPKAVESPSKVVPESSSSTDASKVVPESSSSTDAVKEQNFNLEKGDSSENASVQPRTYIRKRAVRGNKISVKEQEEESSSEKQVLEPKKGASPTELVAAGEEPHKVEVPDIRTRRKRAVKKKAVFEGEETTVPKKRVKKSPLKSEKLSTTEAHLDHAVNGVTSEIAPKSDVTKPVPESQEAGSLNGQGTDPEASDSDSSDVGLQKDKPVVVTIIRRKRTNRAKLDKTWMELTGKKEAEETSSEAPKKNKRGRPPLPDALKKPKKPKPIYIQCSSCIFKTISQDMYIQHQLIHNVVDNLGQYRCDQCSFRTTTKELLLQHEASKHVPVELSYKCAFCEYSNRKKVSAMNHTLRHDDKDISSMFYCLVTNHMTEEEYYECFQCPFQSLEESVMPDHVIEHQVEEIHNPILYKYSCTKCDYKTKTEKFYKRHLELHVEDKNRDWARKYIKKEDPEEEVANADTIYTCPFCPYSTRNKRSLTNHKARHNPPGESKSRKDPQNVYQCNECPYTACKKSYLVRHMLLHRSKENIEFFECPHCLFETKHRRSYTRHMEVRHKTIV